MPRQEPSLSSRLFRLVWSRATARASSFASIEHMRAVMERRFNRPLLPPGVTRQVENVSGLRAEWLIPARIGLDGVLFYLHGGAWTLGWYQPHRWLVAHLAKATGLRAFALDYRLAPEHPFPAALEDCLMAYRWLLGQGFRPDHIVIAGDSAGGNLTLTTMISLREAGEPLPRAAVCLSPVTDLAEAGESGEPVPDAGLPISWAQAQLRSYLGDTDPRLPLVSPFYGDLHGLPALLIQVGGEEILRRDAQRFVPRARAAGVDVTLQVWPGMWHVWQILVPFMPEAREAVQEIAAFIRERLQPQSAVNSVS